MTALSHTTEHLSLQYMSVFESFRHISISKLASSRTYAPVTFQVVAVYIYRYVFFLKEWCRRQGKDTNSSHEQRDLDLEDASERTIWCLGSFANEEKFRIEQQLFFQLSHRVTTAPTRFNKI